MDVHQRAGRGEHAEHALRHGSHGSRGSRGCRPNLFRIPLTRPSPGRPRLRPSVCVSMCFPCFIMTPLAAQSVLHHIVDRILYSEPPSLLGLPRLASSIPPGPRQPAA